MLQHIQERRQDEKGFTLIELMVVVLIMGILMAIAIPTFLSTRGSANDASAKSNATNAFTNEKSYYASNLTFLDSPVNGNGATMDDSLPWDTAATYAAAEGTSGDVSAFALTGGAEATTSPYQGTTLVIEALSKSGNCFYINDVESGASAYIGYAETSAGCNPSADITVMTAAASAGTAGAHVVAEGTAFSAWYQSW